MADAAELESLRLALTEKQEAVDRQASLVRSLKASHSAVAADLLTSPAAPALNDASPSHADVEAAVSLLQQLKLELQSASKDLAAAVSGNGPASGYETFRKNVNKTLESRLFIIPSFQIYGGVSGLYDYGPPGCAVKANVLAFWRQVLPPLVNLVHENVWLLCCCGFLNLIVILVLHGFFIQPFFI
jgi:glycyl-tRNA synthetase